jgi:hypothetical protein
MKIILPIAIMVLLLTALLIYGIHWAFFDVRRIEGQEVIEEVISPNDNYTITAYLNNGGATSDYAVLCSVTDNQTGKERNIYWKYHCSEAEIEWKDEKTVIINGVELDVLKDSYDYRND